MLESRCIVSVCDKQAEAWQVDVAVARRMLHQYAVLYGIGLGEAVDRLRGMGYSEAVREIGER
jgi:hypothetical protein